MEIIIFGILVVKLKVEELISPITKAEIVEMNHTHTHSSYAKFMRNTLCGIQFICPYRFTLSLCPAYNLL